MNRKRIDKKRFDEQFRRLFAQKEDPGVVYGQFDMEYLPLDAKPYFIIQLLLSFREISHITYRVVFWENNDRMISFMESNLSDRQYSLTTFYIGRESPGIIYIEDKRVDDIFLAEILKNHFNYEMGKEPTLQMRLQICIDPLPLSF